MRPLKDLTETRHRDATLECTIDPGQPLAKIYWYKDSREIYNGHKHHVGYVDNVATLIVFDLETSDAGTYTCEASNKLGRTDTVAKLTVLGECN